MSYPKEVMDKVRILVKEQQNKPGYEGLVSSYDIQNYIDTVTEEERFTL